MNNISWFKIVSRRDREKNEKKYKEKMFPLGESQQDREQALLKELLPNTKDSDQLLYHLICAKECLMEEDSEWREEGLEKWLGSSLMQRLSAGERATILALAQIEQECTSMEEFPDVEQVLAKVKELGRM